MQRHSIQENLQFTMFNTEVLYVAKYDFTLTQENEVSLHVGDIVEEVEELPGDWWRGRVNGVRGTFPASFLEQIRSTGLCTVIFPFTPRYPDEVFLEVGQEVVMFGELGCGSWARGRVGAKLGCFPLTHVRKKPTEEIVIAPVLLRASWSKAGRPSTAEPVSGSLFDTEVEPSGPLFGSVSTKLGDISVQSSGNVHGGFLSSLRNSLRGNRRQSEGERHRLNSASSMETRSVCSGRSPAQARKASNVSSFLRRFSLSSKTGSKDSLLQQGGKDSTKASCLYRSWNSATKTEQKQQQLQKLFSLNEVSEIVKIETDFRYMSLSPEAKVHPGPSSTLSWVWQELSPVLQPVEFSNQEDNYTRSSHLVNSDSAIGSSGAASRDEEDPFGPIEDVTDKVFSDMFSPSKKQEHFCGQVRTFTLQASAPLPRQLLGSRSGTASNPLLRWRGEQGQEVTRL